MAYFPNGSSGEILDRQCSMCLLNDDKACPVYIVQECYNYDQVGIDKMEELINRLVNDKGVCQMKRILDDITPEYVERRKLEINGQMSLFGIMKG
jgi:hypothetical protein